MDETTYRLGVGLAFIFAGIAMILFTKVMSDITFALIYRWEEKKGIARAREMTVSREIEPNIKPVCDALNKIESVRTRYSCQGHFWRSLSPYIMFDADTKVAAELEKELRADSVAFAPKLKVLWEVTGHFDGEFQLCFNLSAPRYRKKAGETYCWAFREKALKGEFEGLTEIVETVHRRHSTVELIDNLEHIGNEQ